MTNVLPFTSAPTSPALTTATDAFIAKTLKAAKDKAKKFERKAASDFLELASLVDKIRESLTKAEVAATLTHEWSLDPADVALLISAHKWLIDNQKVLNSSLSLTAIKMLAKSPTRVKNWAIAELAKEAQLTTSDIANFCYAKDIQKSANCNSVPTKGSKKQPSKMAGAPLTCLEICAGAGGMALGLKQAGFHSIGMFERDSDAANTLRANFDPKSVHTNDICTQDFSSYAGKVDLLCGGVPCQPFSAGGLKKGKDDTRDLFWKALDIVEEIRPRAIFLENVLGFGQANHSLYRARIYARLDKLGYEPRLIPISAAECGLGQRRPRLALIALQKGQAHSFCLSIPENARPQTLSSAISDLMGEHGWKGIRKWKTKADLICPTLVGGSERSSRHSFGINLRKEEWASMGIDSTAIAVAAPDANAPVEHLPKLTLKMGARLQGFPDDWIFTGSDRAIRRQIGNALPPIMAKIVGLAITEALSAPVAGSRIAVARAA